MPAFIPQSLHLTTKKKKNKKTKQKYTKPMFNQSFQFKCPIKIKRVLQVNNGVLSPKLSDILSEPGLRPNLLGPRIIPRKSR